MSFVRQERSRMAIRWVLPLLLLSGLPVLGDTVSMNDGRKITGKILQEDATSVTLDVMSDGIRGQMRLRRSDIQDILRKELPPDYFTPPKAATQPTGTSPPATKPAPLDAESQAIIDKLKSDITGLQKDLTAYQAKLASTPATTNIYTSRPGESLGSVVRARGGPYPNPEYDSLKKQVQATRDAIASKTKEMADLISNPAQMRAAVQTARLAEEAGKRVLADLKAQFADPSVVAGQVVTVLLRSKAIEDAAKPVDTGVVDARKAVMYKAEILNMSTAMADADAVRKASPTMNFLLANYKFTFLTEAGLVRVNVGCVLLCQIDGVWWPIQVDIDGMGAFWEAYEHPLATPVLMQEIVAGYGPPTPVEHRLTISGLGQGAVVKVTTAAAPATQK